MKIYKRAAALVTVLALVLAALTGCHGSRGRAEFQPPLVFDEYQKIELSFWAKNDTNKTQTKIYEKAIDDFEKLYPNIEIKLRLYCIRTTARSITTSSQISRPIPRRMSVSRIRIISRPT